jgi:hypothetical protein
MACSRRTPITQGRAQVVPSEPVTAHNACDDHAQAPYALAPVRMSRARLLETRFLLLLSATAAAAL